jgi:hypothetical protein
MPLKFKIKVEVSGTGDCPKSIQFCPKSLEQLPRPNRSLEGLKVDFQLNDDTAVTFTLQGADDMGNPTNVGLGNPTVTSISDPTVVTAVINADNSLTVTPLKIGLTQVVVTDTASGATVTGQLNVTVVPTAAVSFNFLPGSTTPIAPGGGPAPAARTGQAAGGHPAAVAKPNFNRP